MGLRFRTARRRVGVLAAVVVLAGLAAAVFLRGDDEESLAEMCAKPPTELTSTWQAECVTRGDVCSKPAAELTLSWQTECIARGHDPPGLEVEPRQRPREETTMLARLRLRNRDGAVGWAEIRTATDDDREWSGFLDAELSLDVVLEPYSAWERADIRSGTCDSSTADRAYHTYSGGRGANVLSYSWSELARRAWVVDVYARSRDFVPFACGGHPGERRLEDDDPASSGRGGGARRDGRTIVVALVGDDGQRGTARLTQTGKGRFAVSMRHREFSGDAGLDDPPAHIRPGTCARPSPGREILLDSMDDDDTDAVWATSHTVVNGSLADLLARPHAIEIHGDFTGDSVASCGTISP